MLLSLMPLAQPNDMLWCGGHLAQRAHLRVACFFVMDGCLNPGLEVWPKVCRQLLDHLPVWVPVDACEQVLIVSLVGQSSCSLVSGFLLDGSFNLPPWVLEAELVVLEDL